MTSPDRIARPERSFAAVGALLVLAVLGGCARTSVEQVQMQALPGLPRPTAVVICDFYQQMPDGRRLVDDFYATAKSSRKPGMAEAMGVGAVVGTLATATAVSGAVGGATMMNQTVQADPEAAAKTIAKQLHKLFADQGWLAKDR
jgi:hypothetical protein